MVPRVVQSCFVSAAVAWMSSHHAADALHTDRPAQPSPGGGIDNAALAELTPDASAEVIPLHQGLGIQFVRHAGPDIRGVVANLSAMGMEPRYSIEEMQGMGPTPWKKYWKTKKCITQRKKQSKCNYFLQCSEHRPIIYSPSLKLGYMKTAKAASTAFTAFFHKHFADAKLTFWAKDVPKDVFIFTFVREPFEHKIAAFAEVDLKTAHGDEKTGHDKSTMFQHVKRKNHYGRFSVFLDDVRSHHFQKGDGRRPEHAGSQLAASLCERVPDYIGHLEKLTADWEQIQELVNLPTKLRTKALPVVHADTSAKKKLYRKDESIPMDDKLREKICKVYPSEFACLGYFTPDFCKPYVKTMP